MSEDAMNRARGAAFERIERSERWRMLFLVASGVVEGSFLLAVIFVADWSDRLHVLVFLAACLVYLTLGVAMFALWAHMNVCTQRVLRGIEIAANGDSS